MTFLRKCHIHPLLLLFIGLSLITGTFMQLVILFTIILIHELGHYVVANHYHWHIEAIVLWVFGGVMQTSETTNRPIREDILVTIAGPLQHLWLFGAIYGLSFVQAVPESVVMMAFYYNGLILAFNLLPIYPLDGGKLLFYTLSAVMPFKRAHQYTYQFSVLACVSLLISMIVFYPITLSAFLLLLFLILENYREWRHHPYLFMRFLLNRQADKKSDVLVVTGSDRLNDVFPSFRRNRYHYIKIAENGLTITETDALTHYFRQHRIKDTLFQIVGSD